MSKILNSKKSTNDLNNYLNLPYNILIKKINDESGTYFFATVLEFDGCQSDGESIDEAYSNIKEAMEGWIETKLENGFEVPLPIDPDTYSGTFMVRLPKTLHQDLAMAAKMEGVSLNQYALYKLSRPIVPSVISISDE